MKLSEFQLSFTLIELIVVVAIVALFSGTSLAFYNQFNETKKLEVETSKLVDVIEFAKKKAVAGDLSQVACSDFNGYQVNMVADRYHLILCCNGICNNNIHSYLLPSNIGVSAATRGSITFPPLLKGITSTYISYQLLNSYFSPAKCKQININIAGLITESECN